MRAEDLMIGDFVNTPKGNYRVTAIQDNDVIFTDYADDIDGAVDIDKVKPIPLTPEILEKNGFKKQDGNKWLLYKYKDDEPTKGSLYYILWDTDEKYLEINSFTSLTGGFERFDFIYFHELQHALRLCKIDKEIVP